MTYREQTFVERCYCDEPATRSCAACHRPRCDAHIAARDLCHRCDEAVQVELTGRASGRWVATATSGVATSMLVMIAHVPIVGLLGAIAAATGTFAAARPLQRRRAIRALGPRLATSVGQVKPAVDYDAPIFPAASPNSYVRNGHG